MPRISITTRIGVTAVAASLATALAGPGGAGAVDIQAALGPDEIVKAVSQDAGELKGTIEETLDSVAPNTRQAVNQTAQETLAEALQTASKVKGTAERTVSETKGTVEQTASNAKDLARGTVRTSVRTVNRTRADAEASVEQAKNTVSDTYSDAQRIVFRTRAHADERIAEATELAQRLSNRLLAEASEVGRDAGRLLRGGSIAMWHDAIGGWFISWSRSNSGCITVTNDAPLAPLSRLHAGAEVNETEVTLDQRGGTTSTQAGC